jgi:hypothetical protein
VKATPIAILCVFAGAFALTGCQHAPTLEEAQAACTKQGGFLVVFYSRKITTAGVGPEIATPGNCVSADKFDKAPAASAPAASASALPTAPAASKPAAATN